MRRAVLAWVLSLGAAALAAGCARAVNLTDLAGPRFAGAPPQGTPAAPPPARGRPLRIVTFNLAYGRQVDRMVALFRSDDSLRDADVVVLQEMNEAGVARLADALGRYYVYYPAAIHPRAHGHFGNAILSRWPIDDDRKLILPHLGSARRMQRIAVGGTLRVGAGRVRVYAVHLANAGDVGREGQRDQARAILDAADRDGMATVVAGDFNAHDIGTLFEARGYLWPTKELGTTAFIFDLDHVFIRGLAPVDRARAAIIPDPFGASDHRPVWVEAAFDPR
jgi:endonuclease/exonuclease/phosphatase family metal-dependent hydrolase